jgi:hypothetical protein
VAKVIHVCKPGIFQQCTPIRTSNQLSKNRISHIVRELKNLRRRQHKKQGKEHGEHGELLLLLVTAVATMVATVVRVLYLSKGSWY